MCLCFRSNKWSWVPDFWIFSKHGIWNKTKLFVSYLQSRQRDKLLRSSLRGHKSTRRGSKQIHHFLHYQLVGSLQLNIKNSLLFLLYCAKACNEYTRPISAILRQLAIVQLILMKTSYRWQVAGSCIVYNLTKLRFKLPTSALATNALTRNAWLVVKEL